MSFARPDWDLLLVLNDEEGGWRMDRKGFDDRGGNIEPDADESTVFVSGRVGVRVGGSGEATTDGVWIVGRGRGASDGGGSADDAGDVVAGAVGPTSVADAERKLCRAVARRGGRAPLQDSPSIPCPPIFGRPRHVAALGLR